MSHENPNDSDQKTQTPVNSSSSNNPSANTDKTTSTHNSETHSVDTPVEHSTDNKTPMPPTEPIPSSSGWNPKKKTFFNIGLFIILIVIGVFLILYAWKLPPIHPNRTAYQ